MADAEYAIVRSRGGSWMPTSLCEPSLVMRVEKRTSSSLMGMLLREDGSEWDYGQDYDGSPSYERRPGWDRTPRARLRAGRIDLARLISAFPTFEEASAGLSAARAAWEAAKDDSYKKAKDEAERVNAALKEEKERLEAKLREDLAAMSDAAREANGRAVAAQREMHQRMTNAAKVAAEACRQAKAA